MGVCGAVHPYPSLISELRAQSQPSSPLPVKLIIDRIVWILMLGLGSMYLIQSLLTGLYRLDVLYLVLQHASVVTTVSSVSAEDSRSSRCMQKSSSKKTSLDLSA